MNDTLTMRSREAVTLVAGRELRTRLKSKAYRVMTAIILLLIVAMIVVIKILSSTGIGDGATVGVTAGDSALAAPMRSSAATIGQDVTVTQVADASSGRDAVTHGDLDALLTVRDGTVHVVVDQELDTGLRNAMNVVARQLTLNRQIDALGGDPGQVHAAVSAASVDVEALHPPHHYDVAQIVLGSVVGVLIYMSLMMQGNLIAQGVVEEKQSRVVELLLATVRPWQLMVGKVLGMGLVGLLQMLIFGVVGVGLATALGVLTLSVSAAVGTVVWFVVWYLLGFFLYAFIVAAAGALVSRQEEAGGVVMPLLIPVIAGYVVGISILPNDPGNSLAEILSIIPLFAPTLMPMRLAMGGVPVWETILSVVLVAALIPLLAWLAGRVYRNAVLRTGARVKLSQALSAG